MGSVDKWVATTPRYHSLALPETVAPYGSSRLHYHPEEQEMEQTTLHTPPVRIDDILALKKKGAAVTCQPSFEINEVDFTHMDNEFQAVLFFCRFSGTIDGAEYSFRKCYARGCPHNLCPHVSQAVMIANRYLQKDYRRLKEVGVDVDAKLFSLDDMVVRFQDFREEQGPTLTLEDYIHIAREGSDVSMAVSVEYLPAVENFGNHKERRTFLLADFEVTTLGTIHQLQRCLTCYATDQEADEKIRQLRIANDRLSTLFKEFDQAGIKFEKRFFE
jgi:hypothetical protein